MKDLNVWKFINECFESEVPVALLVVLGSKGSSPGRQGFKMSVSADGGMAGSIGGGAMEKTIIDSTIKLLKKGNLEPKTKQQIHRKGGDINSSGMICSGEQSIAIVPLNKGHQNSVLNIVEILNRRTNATLTISFDKISVDENIVIEDKFQVEFESEEDWIYQESLGFNGTMCIIGAGHVGVALSKLMSELDYKVMLFDDRGELNTFNEDSHADEKIIANYESIGEMLPEGEGVFVAIVTFGYLSDEIVVRQLLDKQFAYLGLMGSKKKVREIFNNLESSGISKESIEKINAPIGVDINSRTPEEIAISIAAEIIKNKNKALK